MEQAETPFQENLSRVDELRTELDKAYEFAKAGLAMTIFYEIEDIGRFARGQQFASYARLVKGQKSSAVKRLGTQSAKMGNRHLKWAFSEALVLYMRESERAKKYVARLEAKHGKGKAISILSAKIGRAIYFMLRRREAFDEERFFAAA